MQVELLAQADRVLSALDPARREAIREIVVDAVHRGGLPSSGRAFIARATGSMFLADVLAAAIAERGRERPDADRAGTDLGAASDRPHIG